MAEAGGELQREEPRVADRHSETKTQGVLPASVPEGARTGDGERGLSAWLAAGQVGVKGFHCNTLYICSERTLSPHVGSVSADGYNLHNLSILYS